MYLYMCEPLEGRNGRYIVPGSRESTCQDCGNGVYVAPSGQRVVEELIIVCIPCGITRLQNISSPELVVLEGQSEEIKTYQKRN